MTFHIGQSVMIDGSNRVSTGGCLVRFADAPRRVLLLGTTHGLVRAKAQPGDVIRSAADNTALGKLQTWTTFRETSTADAALVWVDPERVSPVSAGGVTPTTLSVAPDIGATVRMVGPSAQIIPHGTVTYTAQDVPLSPLGDGWGPITVVYAGQILCSPKFSHDGDSGSIVIDAANSVIGMVVAGRSLVQDGDNWVSQTVVTPIASILNHPDFGGRTLELLGSIPADAEGPTGLPQ